MSGAKRCSDNLKVILRDYLITWTIGSLLGMVFWVCWIRGDIKIAGYRRLVRAAWRGRLMIVANHPSLVEPVLIVALGWPLSMIFRRYYFWSMPDDALFPARLRWLYRAGRCIVVDRQEKDKTRNRAAIRQAVRVLQCRNTVSIHPEGGRTRKWQQRGVRLLSENDRQVAEVKVEVVTLAKASGCIMLPLWVGMSPERERVFFEDFSVRNLFRRDLGPIELRFDHEPYSVQLPFSAQREKERLEARLLSAAE